MYYVYCHRNPITKDIFYIGKGSNNRAYVMQSRGKYWFNYIQKYGIPIVELLYENLTEEEAFKIESELIEKIGRSDLNKGPLVNTTNGGEGSSGLIHSKETKIKLSDSRKNKPANNKGKTWVQKNKSVVQGSKRGNYKTRIDKGKIFGSEIKDKMKEGKRNNTKKVLQYDLQNNFIKEWRSAADVIDLLKLKGIYNCLTGISTQSGGYIWKYKK